MQVGDVTLIEASRRGDRDAFAQIIERYQRAVYAVAYSGVRDRALADDVTQDTFVIAWRRLDDLRDAERLAAWLCGIARNRARDLRRQSARETTGDVDDVAYPTTPFDVLSDAETERILAAALDRVPDVYREPLVLYYYEERSVSDVARSLGISAATTNKRISRGRKYLATNVATVERELVRRGPSPALATSVLALLAVTVPAAHVEASTTPVKGSTMHKLAIAAIVTATVGGGVALIVTASRGDAHARTPSASSAEAAREAPTAGSTKAAAADSHGALCDLVERMQQRAPSLAHGGGAAAGAVAASAEANDCATVGAHLAELEGDTTHGPDDRPDEATCAQCAAHYSALCEAEGWSAERRTCTLAAGDLINAHLCAGGVPTTAAAQPSALPASLTCAVLGPHLAGVAQGAGMHSDVPDMGEQVAAACELANWPVELRTCFAAATTVDALKGCIAPALQP
jgi:RNA polymerase sigma factor (sigma-70 family)